MRSLRAGVLGAVVLTAVTALCGPERAHGDLNWEPSSKELMRLRLVALAWNHPRSSFFPSAEIFVAEKQLDKNEGHLVKLIFEFLPYQPRLSEYGFDYATQHELRAAREPSCDESLAQMMTGQNGDWRQTQPQLKYSTGAPILEPDRHKNRLPCYITDAEDYRRALVDPPPPDPPVPPMPHLKTRNPGPQ